jgi:hypothetical protein
MNTELLASYLIKAVHVQCIFVPGFNNKKYKECVGGAPRILNIDIGRQRIISSMIPCSRDLFPDIHGNFLQTNLPYYIMDFKWLEKYAKQVHPTFMN